MTIFDEMKKQHSVTDGAWSSKDSLDYGRDRRQLFKAIAAGAAGYLVVRAVETTAFASCQLPSAIADQNYPIGRAPVFGYARQKSGARDEVDCCVLIAHQQSSEHFVEKVVLTDAVGRVLETRYLSASDRLSSGECPYLMFRGLPRSDSYGLVYRVRSKDTEKVFRFEMQTESGGGTFPSHHGNLQLQTGLSGIYQGENLPLVTTAFAHQTPERLAAHHVRARFLSYNSETGDFKVLVEAMHPDVSAQHFCSHFFLTDPVGRVLGLRTRAFGGKFDVAPNPLRGFLGGMVVQREIRGGDSHGAGEQQALEVESATLPRLDECPEISVYCFDGYDCLARTSLAMI